MQAGRGARGKPMVNLLPLEEGEKINAVLPIKQFDEQHFVFMATSQGTVKKTPLSAFSRPRASGIIAVNLDTDDRLVGVALTDGTRVYQIDNGSNLIAFDLATGRHPGRRADDELTLFKSGGGAHLDLMAAQHIFDVLGD